MDVHTITLCHWRTLIPFQYIFNLNPLKQHNPIIINTTRQYEIKYFMIHVFYFSLYCNDVHELQNTCILYFSIKNTYGMWVEKLILQHTKVSKQNLVEFMLLLWSDTLSNIWTYAHWTQIQTLGFRFNIIQQIFALNRRT